MKLPFKINLFWRTFVVLLLLLITSFALWSQGFALWQQYPRAQALAGQLITAVNVTRSALIYAQTQKREALLATLNKDERMGVYLREPTDTTSPIENTRFMGWLASSVYEGLGNDTELALKVNDEQGLWVSFNIGGKELGVDSYWLRFDSARLEPRSSNPTRWWLWMGLAIVVALAGAAWITSRLTQPLSALAKRMQDVAEFKTHHLLPETGAKEIASVNAGMNRMVLALTAQENERSFMLASLSHDLRTPLARLRLEAEMARLAPETLSAMVGDIEQMDAQLTQLTDFVGSNHPHFTPLCLAQVVTACLDKLRRDPSVNIDAQLESSRIHGDERLLSRALSNAFENASRYGRSSDGQLRLSVKLNTVLNNAIGTAQLVIKDEGVGIPADKLGKLLTPFTRGDTARSGTQGSGLGLAIMDRVAQQHGGSVHLNSDSGRGFSLTLTVPLLDSALMTSKPSDVSDALQSSDQSLKHA